MARIAVNFVRLVACGLVGVALLSSRVAEAQVVPLGGRTATMGGAAIASGNDSAMPFINPAGLAGLPKDVFALSANVYGLARRSVNDFIVPTYSARARESIEDSFLSRDVFQLPSSVMYLTHLSSAESDVRSSVAVSLIIPTAERSTFIARQSLSTPSIRGGSAESITEHVESTDYYVGPTYGLAIGNRLRLGVSFFALYTEFKSSLQRSYQFYEFGGSIGSKSTSSSNEDDYGLSAVGVAGIQLGLTEDLWLGASIMSPAFGLRGRALLSIENSLSGSAGLSTRSVNTDGLYRYTPPLRAGVGVSYERRQSFALAADLSVTGARGQLSRYEVIDHSIESSSGELTRDYRRYREGNTEGKSVIDFSLGAEVWAADWLAVRFGGFTAKSNMPELDLYQSSLYSSRIDRYGATLGLGLLTGAFESTVGVVYERGDGKILVYDPNDKLTGARISDISENFLMLVLAAAVTVESAKDQIENTLPSGAKDKIPFTLPGGVAP